LLGVAASAVFWSLGELAGINALRQLAVVAMLLALVLTVLGPASARALALPILFLMFCVNAFAPLAGPLMHLDARSGVAALRLTGVPAQLDGLTIATPFGRWQVIEACGGLDYVLIFAMSGVLFASLALQSPLRRVLFVMASIAAAMLANGLRMWGIVFAVHARGGVDQDHSTIGWTAFAIVFVLLFAIGRRFSQPEPPSDTPAARTPLPGESQRSAALALAALAIAAAAPAAVAALERHSADAASGDGCRVLERSSVERDGVPAVRTHTECSGSAGVEQAPLLAKATFHDLAPDSVMVSGTRRIAAAGPAGAFDAATLTTLGSGQQFRMTYWYEVGNFATGSRVEMKWHFALARMAGRDARVTVFTEVQALDAAR